MAADGPDFAVTASTHSVGTLSAGEAAGRFHPRFVVGAVLTTALCAATILVYLLSLTGHEPGAWWWFVAQIAGAILSLLAIFALGVSVGDEFHRSIIGVWTCVMVVGASLFVGGGWLLFGVLGTDAVTGHRTDVIRPAAVPYLVEPTVVGLIVAVIGLGGLIASVRRTRREAAQLSGSEAAHSPYPGTIVAVPAPIDWTDGEPRFADVMVRYQDAAGEQVLAVGMRTAPQRVPVEGSAVLVHRGASGELVVEADPEHPMTFDPDTAEYEDPGTA